MAVFSAFSAPEEMSALSWSKTCGIILDNISVSTPTKSLNDTNTYKTPVKNNRKVSLNSTNNKSNNSNNNVNSSNSLLQSTNSNNNNNTNTSNTGNSGNSGGRGINKEISQSLMTQSDTKKKKNSVVYMNGMNNVTINSPTPSKNLSSKLKN